MLRAMRFTYAGQSRVCGLETTITRGQGQSGVGGVSAVPAQVQCGCEHGAGWCGVPERAVLHLLLRTLLPLHLAPPGLAALQPLVMLQKERRVLAQLQRRLHLLPQAGDLRLVGQLLHFFPFNPQFHHLRAGFPPQQVAPAHFIHRPWLHFFHFFAQLRLEGAGEVLGREGLLFGVVAAEDVTFYPVQKLPLKTNVQRNGTI
jgi:hypothetical protein